ncbi:hypothetical protein EH228_02030 [Erwinia endophytica]|uniref:type VI secretion system protein TssA n=1 Tax=Erwinia endophytica TaxID=1563158 RepID=UPI001265DD36|nr:type VI secretion system ImpA family N-terminal domain-containing protein [Erwinia endophytica]KAB8313462.1 hypothetical protein EH228_02030 [Erwinia endophytica]
MAEIHTTKLSSYYQHLLDPIPGEWPCGENLEYDAGFIMLQSKLQPRLDVEYGNFVEAAEPVNWAEIERECLALLQKSKDIRLVIALIRCRTRQIGLMAINEGLQALHHLLIAFPVDIHPQLLEDGEFDPLMRANALSEMEDVSGLLTDIRNQTLPKAAGLQITIKEFEKANASPREEGALPEATVTALLYEWDEREDKTIHSLREAWACLAEIKDHLRDSLGHDTPDFSRLTSLLNLFVTTSYQSSAPQDIVPVESGSEPETETEPAETSPVNAIVSHDAPVTSPQRIEVQKTIENRSDALSKLREIRTWFTKMEPSSPVIPLLAFAESTVGKRFSELLKILPPDMIEKIDPDKE